MNEDQNTYSSSDYVNGKSAREIFNIVNDAHEKHNGDEQKVIDEIIGRGFCQEHAEYFNDIVTHAACRVSLIGMGARGTSNIDDDPLFIISLKYFKKQRPFVVKVADFFINILLRPRK